MKKQILTGTLALSIILSGAGSFANTETNNIQPIKAEINIEQSLDLRDVKGYYKGNTLMVPLRHVAENKLGFEVIWNNENMSIELKKGAQWTSIKIGENSYFFARVAPFELSQAPELKDGLTFVPVEFFSQVLKYDILTEENIELKKEEILHGFIKDILEVNGNKSILVAGDESTVGLDEMLLHINKDTVILDKKDNLVSIDDLKVGTKVSVVLPEIMTMSLPAQGSATKIVVEDRDIEIIKKEHKDNKEIKYPEIQGMKGELTEGYINQGIEAFVNSVKDNEYFKDLKLNYEISFLNDEKMSIVFGGSYKMDKDVEKYFVRSLNFDLKSSNEITFENYFKDDKASQEKLTELLNEEAKERGLSGFEAEGRWIKFRGSNVIVFYYPLDDSVTAPVELYLSLEDVKDIINNNFGEHPAS